MDVHYFQDLGIHFLYFFCSVYWKIANIKCKFYPILKLADKMVNVFLSFQYVMMNIFF
jgi:hypothetical protein